MQSSRMRAGRRSSGPGHPSTAVHCPYRNKVTCHMNIYFGTAAQQRSTDQLGFGHAAGHASCGRPGIWITPCAWYSDLP